MQPLTGLFTTEAFPDLLVGLNSPDDAAVLRLTPDLAIISTMDFFPPVVDDPYDYGAIAAANALSDIYAMGGQPLMALNLVAYPDGYGLGTLSEILRGGAEKVREAGAVIAGGHTVTDKEPKYGLAVTGRIHPEQILTKAGSVPGDLLVLTKPLGSGVITTALKRDLARASEVEAAVKIMKRLNRAASELALKHGAHSATDITGYGLIGHAHEMAHLGGVCFEIDFAALEWIDGALRCATLETFAGGLSRNRAYFETWVRYDVLLADNQRNLLFDPQTSGGLLIALPSGQAVALYEELRAHGEPAAIIGRVTGGSGEIRIT